MTTTPKVLIQPIVATPTETLCYVSKDCKTAIDKFTATNIGAAIATLTVHVFPAGGAAAATNAYTQPIQPGKSYTFPEIVGHNLEAGDSISISSSDSASLWVRASGRQFT